MLKVVGLPYETRGAWWTLSPLTGSLLRHHQRPNASEFRPVPPVVSEAVWYCNHPFSCQWHPGSTSVRTTRRAEAALDRMHRRLLWLGNRRFLLSVWYGSLGAPLFDTTREAMSAIAKLPDQRAQRTKLCLQRSLLAAKTSRSFRGRGVLFIGAQLASADMHAWIIEGGAQPDHEDRSWINYHPLLALIRT